MPNKWTFQIKPIKNLLERYSVGPGWIDPFAGSSRLAEITNDINPGITAEYNLEAHKFLRMFEDESKEGILIDPPYSFHQINEVYEGYGKRRYKKISIIKIEAARIIKPGGYAISCGWNSNGIGKKRGFEIIEVLLVAHGGSHNDTIVVVERKR